MLPPTLDQSGFRRWVDTQSGATEMRCELLNGEIIREPPASWAHGIIGSRLNALLAEHARQWRLGVVVDASAGYELPTGDTVEPDVSFIASDRWAAAPTPQAGEFFRIVPNLVIEILSPATARRDRREKKLIYELSGVDEYWIVDIDAHSVDVFILESGRYGGPHRHRTTLPSATLPGLEVDLEELFALPR